MAQASCCYLRGVWRLSESAGMMDVGGWSWRVCVVIARRSVCRDLSSDITGRAFSLQNLQQLLKTRLRAISLRNAPTTCVHVTKGTSDDDNNNDLYSSSCTMTVVLHHANCEHPPKPPSTALLFLHRRAGRLAAAEHHLVRRQVCLFHFHCAVWSSDGRLPCTDCLQKDQACRHCTMSATWECRATQGADTMALSPHINIGREWLHLRPPWP